jgi:hypothetical protein
MLEITPEGRIAGESPEVKKGEPDQNPFGPGPGRLPAEVVGGAYAAAICSGLNKKKRECLVRLNGVRLADLAALKLIGADLRPTRDDVRAWYESRCLTWHPPTTGIASIWSLKAATAGIDPIARFALADVVAAAEDGHQWAISLVEQARSLNKIARRGGKNGGERPIAFSPAGLLAHGVPPSAVATLPTMTTVAHGRSVDQIDLWDAEDRAQTNVRARQAEAARTAAEVTIPERVNLAEHVPSETRWIVDQILARGAVLGLFAERKAGKTTVVRELVRAALHGEPFLGQFAVSLPADSEVVLFDTEMPLDSLHEQYRRAGVEHLGRLNLRELRGREQSLDARVEANRARWRTQIEPGSLIVVDCIYSLFGALGVSENSDEVVGVLAGLRALATECDAAGLVIVHHLGKDIDRGARGHSSIEGFPDAIARIGLDGPPSAEAQRTFSAYGRDVSVSPGVLALGDDHRLTLGGNPSAERRTAARRADDDAVWSLIERHPGLSVRKLGGLPVESRGKLSRDRIRVAVERLEQSNRIVNKGTAAAPEWHEVTGADPFAVPGNETA